MRLGSDTATAFLSLRRMRLPNEPPLRPYLRSSSSFPYKLFIISAFSTAPSPPNKTKRHDKRTMTRYGCDFFFLRSASAETKTTRKEEALMTTSRYELFYEVYEMTSKPKFCGACYPKDTTPRGIGFSLGAFERRFVHRELRNGGMTLILFLFLFCSDENTVGMRARQQHYH